MKIAACFLQDIFVTGKYCCDVCILLNIVLGFFFPEIVGLYWKQTVFSAQDRADSDVTYIG